MSLKIRRTQEGWVVTQGLLRTIVAEILFDPWYQVGEVVLYADTSEQIQLEVLRLVASHVRQFVRHRTTSFMGGHMVAEHRGRNFTLEDSKRLMDFSAIPPEILSMNRATIEKELHELRISISLAISRQVEEAINAAIDQVGVVGLGYEVVHERVMFSNERMIRFIVEAPNSFTFWHSMSRPTNGRFDLYVIPNYHPVMNGKESIGLVNGDTDANIRGNAVRSIYCPEDARTADPSKYFGTSWTHVKHPYYAKGQSFSIRLITTKVRTAEGVQELTTLLRAALGLNNKYMGISGGFRAPLKCSHNRLIELGRRSPWPEADYRGNGNIVRGSEQFCVWAYQVLKDEGQLENAYVPSWFTSEGWPQIYDGAEVRHGLY